MKKVLSFVLCIMMLTMSFNIITFAQEDTNLAAKVMTKEVFEASNGISMPYRLYVPSGYSAEKEYSFLLFLHGAGNRGNDNESQVSVNTGLINRIISGETVTANGQIIDSSQEFIIVAPQCAAEFQWVDTSWSVLPDPSYKLDEMPQSKYMTAVVELIDAMKEKYNLAVIFITHDLSLIQSIADKILVMYSGLVLEYGKAAEVLSNPLHPYTQGLLSSIPRPGANYRTEKLVAIPGNIPDPTNPPPGCPFAPRCKYAKDICRENVSLKTLQNNRQYRCIREV